MPYSDPTERRIANRIARKKWRLLHPEESKERDKRHKMQGASAKYRAAKYERKKRVLAHYGPLYVLRCSWPECLVSDVDMLTLDHVDDDGAAQRALLNLRTGDMFYRWLEVRNFPKDLKLQTLCCNHQMKKHLVRVRARADAAYIQPQPYVITQEERDQRRARATGKIQSAETRHKQSLSHTKRLENPGARERHRELSLIAASAWKKKWDAMSEEERQQHRNSISEAQIASWRKRRSVPR